ncbi:MAG TPA: hypothetical protein VJ964_05275 [Balneolaceae bacterium]|nr:hypothetical protein [Balneolaceae bacterium]
MKEFTSKWSYIVVIALVAVLSSGCASSGSTKSNKTRIYDKNYNDMVQIVKQAVVSGNVQISYVDESDKPKRMLMIYTTSGSIRGHNVQTQQGKIHIRKMANLKTQVTIENPEHDVMVSDYEVKDYRRYFFRKIDAIISKSKS